MTHPKVTASVDGVPVSGVFMEKLVSLSITDREGIRADTVSLTFNDAPPHFQSPRRGAVISVTLSAGIGAGFVGAFVVDRVEYKCLPHTITVKGHSADLRSEMKANKTKHWDDIAVKQLVEEKAGDYGLKPKVASSVAAHVYDWIGQQDESDLNFLERLARRHGALFTIKNGALLWLERGAGKTADGTSLDAITVAATSIVKGTCIVSETDVDRFKRVKAYWQDRRGAKRQEVLVDADPEAEGDHVLQQPFASRKEAEAAAKSAAQEVTRGLITTQCVVAGRPDLMAGQPMVYVGVRTGIDGRTFILEEVTHDFSKKSGLRTTFQGKLKAS